MCMRILITLNLLGVPFYGVSVIIIHKKDCFDNIHVRYLTVISIVLYCSFY